MPAETSVHVLTPAPHDPAPSGEVSRRRFMGYVVAAPALSLAAQMGLGEFSPTPAAAAPIPRTPAQNDVHHQEETVITSYAKAPVRSVTADGTTYSYRELGPKGGIPVVFFCHLAGNLDNWDPRIIDPIAEHRHVITFDNKGVGASTGRVPGTLEEAADDAYTFIKALDLDLIDVFSFSMGGMIAQDLVLKHPDLIRKLVLTGTGPRGGKDMDKVVGTTYWDITRATLTRSDPKEYLFFNRNATGKRAAKAFIKRLQERTVDRDKAMSLVGFQTQLSAIAKFGRSAPSDLSAITHPTLIANGDNDRMVPSVLSEDLHRRIKGSELVIYPDSGHGGIFQYHEKFAPVGLEFLGR
jgi:pimeloyl-ACP methyl ester carboxylesterase